MTPIEAKKKSRGISSDMSPEAISRRLQICSDLSAACRVFGKAVPVVPGDNASSQLVKKKPSAT